jgi:drug/metabolite transporter (DMT)-like permease
MTHTNLLKAVGIALLLMAAGYIAAHNARWIRDGVSPWWTSYLFSIVTASTYAYLLRSNIFSLTYTSVFQTFFFHASWYITALFVLGEQLSTHRLVGLAAVFLGMILMSIK